jgi:hypothetical protein
MKDFPEKKNYPGLRILDETDRYFIGHEYENAYLIDKRNGEEIVYDDFYGDPRLGIISRNNDWGIIAGEHITIWSNGKTTRIDREELRWVHAIRMKDDRTVEILIDPFSEMSAIWTLEPLTLEFKKVRDFDDYKDMDYRGEEVVW